MIVNTLHTSVYISSFTNYDNLLGRIQRLQTNCRTHSGPNIYDCYSELRNLILEYFNRKLFDLNPNLNKFRSLNGRNFDNVPLNRGNSYT